MKKAFLLTFILCFSSFNLCTAAAPDYDDVAAIESAKKTSKKKDKSFSCRKKLWKLGTYLGWSLAWASVYTVLRAKDDWPRKQNDKDIVRTLTWLGGFPFSVIPWAFVEEGSYDIFGLKVAR